MKHLFQNGQIKNKKTQNVFSFKILVNKTNN